MDPPPFVKDYFLLAAVVECVRISGFTIEHLSSSLNGIRALSPNCAIGLKRPGLLPGVERAGLTYFAIKKFILRNSFKNDYYFLSLIFRSFDRKKRAT